MPFNRAALALGLLLVAPTGPGAEPPDVAARPPAVDAIPRGPSVEARLAEIRRRVQAALRYPGVGRMRGLEGVARVGFELDRDGTPRELALVRSSGHRTLDRAALRSVTEAAPLPWVYGRVVIPVHFELEEAGP